MDWDIVAVILSLIAILLSGYQFKQSNLLIRPSFYIDLWSRMGASANIELKILESTNTDYFLDNVIFLTDQGSEIQLDYNHNRHRILVTIPNEDYMFSLKGNLIINYRIKNNKKYKATSPNITFNDKYSLDNDHEHYLDIGDDITNRIFK